ncbi:MAG TPA: hypothetical protein VGE75_02325 [Acidimicrobiales bacterium]
MNTSGSGRLLSHLRGMRYGEVLLAYLEGDQRVEVFNSFPMNQCPDELWRALDPEILAKEAGATFALLNGPRYWLMDGIGKVPNVEPVIRDFGGIEMRRVATLELDGDVVRSFYRERHVNRGAIWYFDAGSTVHELTSPDAKTYVMQAYCTGVDESLSETSLRDLGAKLHLPDGWSYSSRVLEADLVVDTTTHVATVLQDELENTYTLVDELKASARAT